MKCWCFTYIINIKSYQTNWYLDDTNKQNIIIMILKQLVCLNNAPDIKENPLHGWFLACLFQRKSWAIVIERSSSLSLFCKNFNVAHYSKSFKGVDTKLGILAHHDKMQWQDKGHNSESCNFGVMPHV